MTHFDSLRGKTSTDNEFSYALHVFIGRTLFLSSQVVIRTKTKAIFCVVRLVLFLHKGRQDIS